jgi:hypothetical protein
VIYSLRHCGAGRGYDQRMEISGKTEGSYIHYTARAVLGEDQPGVFGIYGDELYLGCSAGLHADLAVRVVMFAEVMANGESFQYLPGFAAEERGVARLYERAAEWYAWVLQTAAARHF